MEEVPSKKRWQNSCGKPAHLPHASDKNVEINLGKCGRTQRDPNLITRLEQREYESGNPRMDVQTT